MTIFHKYLSDIHELPLTEVLLDHTSITQQNQAYTVDELLRRAQNGTFPDINFHQDFDFEGEAPEDVVFNEVQDFTEAMDISQALDQTRIIQEKIKKVKPKK